MQSSHTLDSIEVMFDDQHLVADAGLILPATLAQHLGLRDLFDTHIDLGDAAGRANVGLKAMTLVHSALAGGDSIDDTDVLRAGATGTVLGHAVRAPWTLGTFLRSFTWGHARQLDKVAGVLLGRAWAAGAEPGDAPVTIDVDSTICETYGLAKQGGTKFTYTHVRGYHPPVAAVAATGDVVHSRLRGGNANTTRGAAGFLTETFNRARAAGATGPLTLRADSGFYAGAVAAACRKADVGFSITVKMNTAIRKAIATIGDDEWTPIPYSLDGADVAETVYRPFGNKAPLVRLIVRRVRPTPGSQLALFVEYSYHGLITDRTRPRSRPPPPCSDRRRHPRPQIRGRVESPPLRQVRGQRGLARTERHRPQPRPLDQPDRPPRNDHRHQHPAPPSPPPPRTNHPLRTPAHPPPPHPLAMASTVQHRPRPTPLRRHRHLTTDPTVPPNHARHQTTSRTTKTAGLATPPHTAPRATRPARSHPTLHPHPKNPPRTTAQPDRWIRDYLSHTTLAPPPRRANPGIPYAPAGFECGLHALIWSRSHEQELYASAKSSNSVTTPRRFRPNSKTAPIVEITALSAV